MFEIEKVRFMHFAENLKIHEFNILFYNID